MARRKFTSTDRVGGTTIGRQTTTRRNKLFTPQDRSRKADKDRGIPAPLEEDIYSFDNST